jgi:WD40 repeat protein/transcriptional regulator with XRE-family HTH domain
MGDQHVYREYNYDLGNQLLILRTRIGLTQIALAELLGANRRSVQKWESGVSYPKAEMLQRLIALFLRHHAFTPGTEREEVLALWEQATQDGPHLFPLFDEVWFARTLALQSASPVAYAQEADREGEHTSSATTATRPTTSHAIMDWGEAIAVPTLYGREGELQTLQHWVVEECCRVVAIVGIGGMGKSSLAITVAQRVLPQFDVVVFRSLQNGPPLAEVLDQAIRAVSDQHSTPPEQLPDKIALLIQLLRARRCLLILDNYEAIMQPGGLSGTYRSGYADYGALLRALSERAHQSCLVLTSREKPAELGLLESLTGPVRSLQLSGLDDSACQSLLAVKNIAATATDVSALARLYGGNPLALHLVAEPIRELFGSDVGAFLAAGDMFFNGVGKLLEQQFARSTPLEQTVLYWLAIERELVPASTLVANLGEAVRQREVLVALESLRRRMLIERGPDRPAFTLQPVILEYVTDQLVEAIRQELVDGQPRLLHSHALIQATARDYVRRSQERLIATPLLERLSVACGGVDAVERQLLTLLDAWRNQPLAEQGYGPGNVVNLLRLRRGHLRGLDLARLAIRQAYLQGVAVQDTSLAGVTIQDSIFTETFDAITAVAVSSTGAYWAAASTRGEVRIWTAGAQALYRMWRAHTDMVWALAFSPDGHTLASGSWDGTVKLWDAGSGALRWLGRHTSHINSVAFAPDGNILASSGNDATVRLWDLRSGAQLQVLPHPAQVSVITWSLDGRLFATGDVVGSIRLWELPQIGPAICVQTLTGHANWVDGLAFAPDGRTLASASWDGTVKLWDTSTHRSGLWSRGHPSSGDTSDQAAHNANVVGESPRQTLAGHTDQVSRVAWSPDGCILASSSRDQTIRLWDIESSSYRIALVGHSAGVKGLAFTPNSRSLLSGSEDGTLRVWDAASGQCIRVVQGYAASLYDLDWSPDGAQLVSGGSDTLVTIYDATGGTPPRVLRGHSGVVLGVGWSSDGRYVASSEWENTIRLWDPVSGASLQVLRHPDDPGNYFYGLAWSPDGQRLASGTWRRGVQVFEFTAQHQRWTEREFPTWIRPVAWSPDGQQLAGGGDDGTLYVWDATDGTLVEQLAGHHSMITSVAWSPAGTRLASGSGGSAGGELFVWDTQRGERLRAFAGHPGIIYAVAWGSSEDVLISGGGNGNLRWWDVQSGTCVWVREAHQGTVQALRRSPDGTKLTSCGDDGAIILWNLRTGEQLQILRRDRPYERMDITGLTGLTEAQRASLIALGAVDGTGDRHYVPDDIAESIATASLPSDARQPTRRDRKVALGLPFQPTPFIGRDAELSEIARLLGDPACGLLTLQGPGGHRQNPLGAGGRRESNRRICRRRRVRRAGCRWYTQPDRLGDWRYARPVVRRPARPDRPSAGRAARAAHAAHSR